MDDIHVLYKDASDGSASEFFSPFAKEMKKSGISFKEAKPGTDGKSEVKQGNYDGFMELNNEGIKLYENDRSSIEGSIIDGVLSSFAGKYNLAVEVAKVDPTKVEEALAPSSGHYIKETTLNSDHKGGSMDYYAIAMTVMIAMYAAMSASSLIRGERARNTADRLMAAPISKGEIFIGKLLGSFVVNGICILIVMGFSKFVFKANWGDHIGMVIILLLTEVIFAISLGLGVSFIAKTGAATRSILMLIVQLSSFIGGAYFVIEDPGKQLLSIQNLSPVQWNRTGLNQLIYSNDFSAAYHTMMLNIGMAVLLLLVTVISLRRREGL